MKIDKFSGNLLQKPLPITQEMRARVCLYNERDTPSALYKYYPPNSKILKSLSKGFILFSDPNSFNDLFDGKVALDANITREELNYSIDNPISLPAESYTIEYENKLAASCHQKTLMKIGKDNIDAAKEYLETWQKIPISVASNFGMTCFSEIWNNKLMWANYAGYNSGFVVEFLTLENKLCWDASPIRYVETYPTKKIHDIIMNCKFQQELTKIPLTKSCDWSHEREWRALTSKGPGYYAYDPRDIQRIFFGPKCANDTKDTLQRIFADFPNISYKQVTPGSRTFELQISDYNPKG